MKKSADSNLTSVKLFAKEAFGHPTFLISIAAMFSTFITFLAGSTSMREVLQSLSRTVIYLILGTIAISALITSFVLLLRGRIAHVAKLKREVTTAFLTALDQSSFNPRRFEDINEQPSPQS